MALENALLDRRQPAGIALENGQALPVDLSALTDAEVAELWNAGEIDLDALTAESDRRDAAAAREAARAARSDRARAAARERHAEWEQAAYANYEAAEVRCRGDANMLSEAGRRTGRAPWPMLWERGRETADKLASDDLITFWDYEQERPPGPAEYAAAKREAAAEQAVRNGAAPAPKPAPKPRRKAAKWIGVTGGAVREAPVRIGDLTVTGWAAMPFDGPTTIHPSRTAAERHLAPPPPAAAEPDLSVPDFSTGTTDDHVLALDRFAGDLADRAKRRAEQVAEILARVAARNANRTTE